jgi:hypothetical protein
MAIIISKNGKNAQRINKAEFGKEKNIQSYIQENPESIPVYEIKEDKKLFVVAREFSTESGPIDALAIDKDGDIYVVETKLYKNPDKRTVVAQALDYGASLWRHSDYAEFISKINSEINKKFKISFEEKIQDFFSVDEEQTDAMLEAVKANLQKGNIKFVILMDAIDERLKDLIVYVNQNSQFDIYAVQMEYYKFENYEIIIPKLFGMEVKKDIAVSTASGRGMWDEKSFFESVEKNLDKSSAVKMRAVYEKFKSSSDGIRWGTGISTGSYAPILNSISNSRSILSVFADGKLTIKFNWFIKDKWKLKNISKHIADEFGGLLSKYAKGLELPENYRDTVAKFEMKEWMPYSDGILKAFEELKDLSLK